MSRSPRRGAAVREPVQVYLDAADRALLDRVAAKSGLSRAEILRRGARRMAAELLADENPMLALMREQSSADWPASTPSDVGGRHDQYLTEAAKAPAGSRKPRKRSVRGRGTRPKRRE